MGAPTVTMADADALQLLRQRNAELESQAVQHESDMQTFRSGLHEQRNSAAAAMKEAQSAHARAQYESQERMFLANSTPLSEVARLTSPCCELEDRLRGVDASKTYAEDVIERTAHAHRIELTTMENRFDHHSNSTIGLRAELERIQRLLSIERDARDNAGTRVGELEEMLRQREGLVDTLTQDCQMAKEKAFDKVDEMDIQRRQAQILAEQAELQADQSQTHAKEFQDKMREALAESRNTNTRLKVAKDQNQLMAEEVQSATKDRNLAESLLDQTADSLASTKEALAHLEDVHESTKCQHDLVQMQLHEELTLQERKTAAAEIDACESQVEAQQRFEDLVASTEESSQFGSERDVWRAKSEASDAAKDLALAQVASYEVEMMKLQVTLKESLRRTRTTDAKNTTLHNRIGVLAGLNEDLEAKLNAKGSVCADLQQEMDKCQQRTEDAEANAHVLGMSLTESEERYSQLLQDKIFAETRLGGNAAALARQLEVETVENGEAREYLEQRALECKQGDYFNPYVCDSLDGAKAAYKESFLAIKSGESVSYGLREGCVGTRRYALGSDVASSALKSWASTRQEVESLRDVVAQDVLNIQHNY